MPKIKFIANWQKKYQKQFDIPKGYIVFKYQDFYRKSLGKVLLKLNDWQEKKVLTNPDDYLRDLEISIQFHYRKRTLDQNALMWSLYAIEANEMNGGQSGHKEQNVTSRELYLADLDEYGERETINTKRTNLGYYLTEYQIIEAVILDNGKELSVKAYKQYPANKNERITLRVIRGSSKFNTKEMCYWIDRIFNRLAYNGVQVTNPGEIENYWQKWKSHLNENKILLHDTIMTKEEYKAFNPICEACGKFIQPGTGELHHIKSIGMGGNRTKEPDRNYTSNWLHLHAIPCHREHWEQGIKKFLKRYKHLTYKTNTALKKNYELIISQDEYIQEGKDSNNIEQIMKLYKAGEIEKDEACMQLEKLGGDPLKIDSEWIGIF